MLSFLVGAIAGGALLGLALMLVTTPLLLADRNGNGWSQSVGRTVRDAWIVAYTLGVASYVALRLSGIIAH